MALPTPDSEAGVVEVTHTRKHRPQYLETFPVIPPSEERYLGLFLAVPADVEGPHHEKRIRVLPNKTWKWEPA